eukprot:12221748-Alexandrium_andersonii.AAC.1
MGEPWLAWDEMAEVWRFLYMEVEVLLGWGSELMEPPTVDKTKTVGPHCLEHFENPPNFHLIQTFPPNPAHLITPTHCTHTSGRITLHSSASETLYSPVFTIHAYHSLPWWPSQASQASLCRVRPLDSQPSKVKLRLKPSVQFEWKGLRPMDHRLRPETHGPQALPFELN